MLRKEVSGRPSHLRQATATAEALSNMSGEVEVRLNGELRKIRDGWSVSDLVASLGLSHGRLAVELNFEIIPKQHWSERRICSGDTIEIVHFVGGG